MTRAWRSRSRGTRPERCRTSRSTRAESTTDVPKGEPEPETEVGAPARRRGAYLGWFRDAETGREVEVVFEDGRLALRIPETTQPVELFPPDADGGWRVRIQPSVAIHFTEEDGRVVSYSARGPGGEAIFTRMRPPAPSPGP